MTLPELPPLPHQFTRDARHLAHEARERILTAEIERLRAECEAMRSELHNIANADTSTWGDEMRDQFKLWAQNRARAAIDAAMAERKGES